MNDESAEFKVRTRTRDTHASALIDAPHQLQHHAARRRSR